jgi:hypothetical protein
MLILSIYYANHRVNIIRKHEYICLHARILNNFFSLDQEFPLSKGWALKENLRLGNKGGGKRISKKVVQYLQGFFLAGNLRAAERYSPEYARLFKRIGCRRRTHLGRNTNSENY